MSPSCPVISHPIPNPNPNPLPRNIQPSTQNAIPCHLTPFLFPSSPNQNKDASSQTTINCSTSALSPPLLKLTTAAAATAPHRSGTEASAAAGVVSLVFKGERERERKRTRLLSRRSHLSEPRRACCARGRVEASRVEGAGRTGEEAGEHGEVCCVVLGCSCGGDKCLLCVCEWLTRERERVCVCTASVECACVRWVNEAVWGRRWTCVLYTHTQGRICCCARKKSLQGDVAPDDCG